jgi:hypothetical protein
MLFRLPATRRKDLFSLGGRKKNFAEFVQNGICMGASLEGEQRHFFDIASRVPI